MLFHEFECLIAYHIHGIEAVVMIKMMKLFKYSNQDYVKNIQAILISVAFYMFFYESVNQSFVMGIKFKCCETCEKHVIDETW